MTRAISHLIKLTAVLALVLGLGYGIGKAPVWANHATCAENNYLHVHWQRTPPNLYYIWYDINIINESGGTGNYQPAISATMSDWNSKQGHVRFHTEVDPVLADTQITVNSFVEPSPIGWIDSTPDECSQSSTHLYRADAFLNSSKIESYINSGTPTGLRQRVAAHELGHTIGLGHSTTADPAVMKNVLWDGYATVQTRDTYLLTFQYDPYGHSD